MKKDKKPGDRDVALGTSHWSFSLIFGPIRRPTRRFACYQWPPNDARSKKVNWGMAGSRPNQCSWNRREFLSIGRRKSLMRRSYGDGGINARNCRQPCWLPSECRAVAGEKGQGNHFELGSGSVLFL